MDKTVVFSISMLAATVAVAAGNPANLQGEWRGQAQYQATIGGAPDPAAHTVTNLTIRVEPDGKVWGTSTENGCKLLGIWQPFTAGINLVNLDVTLSGCKYDGMNRRYLGTLSLQAGTSTAALSLMSSRIGVGKAAMFDVKATMKR